MSTLILWAIFALVVLSALAVIVSWSYTETCDAPDEPWTDQIDPEFAPITWQDGAAWGVRTTIS